MKHTTFIFAGIMSAIIGNAYATGENTVTSKSYVDAQDALKQDVIDTDMIDIEVADKNGGTQTVSLPALVSYDSGNGGLTGDQFGIWSTSTPMPINGVDPSDYDKIIPTFGLVSSAVDEWLEIKQNKMTCAGWPDGATSYDTTHTDANCWLWYKN